MTFLHFAAMVDRKEASGFLLHSGTDVSAQDANHGYMPLLVAAPTGDKELAKPLLVYGADVRARGINGGTPRA